MEIIQKLDISGMSPTFLLFGKHKSETFLGGIFTILLTLIGIGCFMILGQNFFFRKNPNIVTSVETTPELTIVKENASSFPVYFRLEDRDGAPVNFSGIFYPYSVYWQYYQDEKGMKQPNRTTISPMEKCNETDMKYIKESPSNYYCMKWNNEPWGGDTDDKFYSFYSFFLSFCPTGFYNNQTCTSTEVIDEIIERRKMWFFSFFYPTYSIQPNNLKEPIKITYKNYMRRLSRNLVKVDVFYFQNVILNDDQGIIFNTYKNFSKIALFDTSSEYYYFDNDDHSLKPGQVAYIYQANFYFSSKFNYVTRSFQKLPDLAAAVGGVIKCFMIVINVICVQLNYNNIIDKIVKHMFDWRKGDEAPLKNVMNTTMNNNNSNNKGNQSLSMNNFFLNKKSDLEIVKEKEKGKGKDKDGLESRLGTKVIRKGSIEKKTDLSLEKIIKAGNNKKQSPSNFYSFIFHYLPFLLTKSPTNKDLYTAYACADAQARKRMDIEYYIKLLFDFTHMQKILLKEYQMVAIEHSKKPNIYQRKELSELYGMYTQEEEEMRYKKQLTTLKNMNKKQSGNDKILIDIINDLNNNV